MKKCLLDLSYAEIEELTQEMNEPKFRAKQLYESVMRGRTLSEMTNLSAKLKTGISEKYLDSAGEIAQTVESRDGTIKYLYKLNDGNVVECVFMRYSYGNTLCISTQVGCRMNCSFCASGIGGLVRNMTSGEILGEVLAINKLHTVGDQRGVTNIVLMGTGEPLDNYDSVIRFLRVITSKESINVSQRNISLSTSGLVPAIGKLMQENIDVNLTISLHSPFDNVRSEIMPVNKSYNVRSLVNAAKKYFEVTKRRVIFEYLLIDGVNDRKEDADELGKLLRGFSYHLNLIRLNYVKEKGLRGTSVEKIKDFMKLLEDRKVSVTLRRSMGGDIDGACGQLRKKYVDDNDGE